MTPEQLRQRRRERQRKFMRLEVEQMFGRHEENERQYELKRQEQKLVEDLMQKATQVSCLCMVPDLFGGMSWQTTVAYGEMISAEARLKAFRAINSRG